MRQSTSYVAAAALVLSGALSSCGSNQTSTGADISTHTPSSTLGTDSAATAAGGAPSGAMSGSTTTGSTMPASGASGSSNASGTGAGTGASAPGTGK